MSITVIKEGGTPRILEATAPIPEGTRLVLVPTSYSPLEHAQLESIFQEDAEDWGTLLNAHVMRGGDGDLRAP